MSGLRLFEPLGELVDRVRFAIRLVQGLKPVLLAQTFERHAGWGWFRNFTHRVPLKIAILDSGMLLAVTLLHVIICLFLIVVVLLQSGKAADQAGAFGGMGSQTVFGPRGTATVLSKATTIAASLFMVTALTLVILANNQAPSSGSVLENRRKAAPVQTPKSNTPAKPVTPSGPKQ